MSVFRFVEREKASFPVTTMCRVPGVSPSGYWAWSTRPPSARARGDAVALALNTRPRKTLGWKTPAEALDKLLHSAEQARVATTP